ncbi:MAG: pseudouridine synthase [Pseudanabaenaceae cyanobacterium]
MYRYLLFHKPYGVLCQFTDDAIPPRPTLKDFIDVPEVYAVGRLDFDSEGLLLLSNDGPLKHQLLDPQFAHERTYWVQVENIPTTAALDQLASGVIIQGYRTKPAKVNLISPPTVPERNPPIRFRQSIPTAWLEITLTEGKNRQVRRMTAAVGHPTLRLLRISMGNLQLHSPQLGNLPQGQWRDCSPDEVQTLQHSLRQPWRLGVKPAPREYHPKTSRTTLNKSPRKKS